MAQLPSDHEADSMPLIRMTTEPIDDAMIRALVARVTAQSDGGVVTFEGIVRNSSRGKRIRYLEYEAYPGMAEAEMAKIAATVEERWGARGIAMIHRTGRLEIGECSVVVVVACPHRAEAFDACRFAIDTLKATVPIWKKEVAEDGAEWIEEQG